MTLAVLLKANMQLVILHHLVLITDVTDLRDRLCD